MSPAKALIFMVFIVGYYAYESLNTCLNVASEEKLVKVLDVKNSWRKWRVMGRGGGGYVAWSFNSQLLENNKNWFQI